MPLKTVNPEHPDTKNRILDPSKCQMLQPDLLHKTVNCGAILEQPIAFEIAIPLKYCSTYQSLQLFCQEVVVYVKWDHLENHSTFKIQIKMKENVKYQWKCFIFYFFHLLSVQEYATCLGNVSCRLNSILIFYRIWKISMSKFVNLLQTALLLLGLGLSAESKSPNSPFTIVSK